MFLLLFDSLDNLDHVLVIEDMILANPLWLMFDRCSPDEGVLQVLDDGSVDLVTEVLHRAVVGLQHNWGLVVRKLALSKIVYLRHNCQIIFYLGFCVNSHKFEIVPHLVQEIIIVPLVMGRDGDRVGNPDTITI